MALVVLAVLSGELGDAAQYLLTLVGGVLLYQGGRWFIRGVSGYDPHDGSTAVSRAASAQDRLPERDLSARPAVKPLFDDDAQSENLTLEQAILMVLGDGVLTYKDIATRIRANENLFDVDRTTSPHWVRKAD